MIRDYCFRSLTQNRTRSLLVVAGIALGAMLLTTVSALGGDMSRLLARPLSRLYGGNLLVLPQSTSFGRLPSGYIGLRLDDSGYGYTVTMDRVQPHLDTPASGFFYLDLVYTDEGHRVPLLARDPAFSGPHGLSVRRGRPFGPQDEGQPVVLVNAGQNRYPVGSEVRLHLPTLRVAPDGRMVFDHGRADPLVFTVVGQYQSPMQLPGPMFIMPLSTFQQATGLATGLFMGIMVPGQDPEATARARELLPGYRVMGAQDMTVSVFAGARFRESGGGFMAVSGTYAWAIILVSCLAMANTNLVVLRQRRLELGILRSLGWKPRQLVCLLSLECFVLGCLGGFAGYFLACVVIQRVVARYGGSILDLPGLGPQYGFTVTLASGVVSVLSVIYPIFQAARTGPAEVIRGA